MNDSELLGKREFGRITVICGDSIEVLPTLPKADCIITDPPYLLTSGGNAKSIKHRKMGGKIASYNNTGEIVPCDIDWQDFMPNLFEALKDDTKAFIMCNDKNLQAMLNTAEQAKFKFHGMFQWFKNNVIVSRWGMKDSEYIGLFFKGKAKILHNPSIKRTLIHSNPMDKRHPTVKPVSLIEELINASTVKGDLVLDPFGGSGTTALACHKLGRKCIIIEKEKKYFDLICDRLDKAVNINSVDDEHDLFREAKQGENR